MFNSNMYEQEEEMMKLAAEMSLRESESSDPLARLDLYDALDQVRICENSLEQVANDSDDEYGGPTGILMEAEDGIRDIEEQFRFEVEDVDIGFPALDDVNRELHSSGEGSLKFPRSSKGRSGRYYKGCSSSTMSGRRISGSGREQRIKDVVEEVLSLSTKLKIKIQYEIKSITDTDDTVQVDGLEPLLLLNDQVDSVLAKAEMLASEASIGISSKSDSESSSVPDAAKYRQVIMECMYALRRGGDRESTLDVINKLIGLCFCTNGICLPAVKQMLECCVLQSLLSTLSRTNDWPEVELQITKIISVLVTYEDDWALLQRSAHLILSSLYTLQLKTQERNKLLRPHSFIVTAQDSNRALSSSTSDQTFRHFKDSKDICTLISAAVAKLALVLSSEWGAAIPQFGTLTPQMMNSILNSYGITSGSSSNRPRSLSNATSGSSDSNRILEILMNLIRTLCENATYSDSSSMTSPVFSDSSFSQTNSFYQSSVLSETDSPDCKSPFAIADKKIECETEAPVAPLPEICNTDVLCSAALSTLTEVPHCRRWLVTGGCLQLIKRWLGLSVVLLSKARSICFKEDSNLPQSDDNFILAFTKQFGTTYELLCNAMAALMYLSGGSDSRFASTNQSGGDAQSQRANSQSGYDYDIGWIDAQILAEGLPELLVSLVIVSTEFVLDNQQKDNVTRSVLPGTVALHVSKILFQLNSRVQNRQQLTAARAPLALAILFESICSRIYQYGMANSATNSDPIFTHIFAFKGVYYNQIHRTNEKVNLHRATSSFKQWESAGDLEIIYSNGIDEENRQRLSLTNPQVVESGFNDKKDRSKQAAEKKTSLRNPDPTTERIMILITLPCLQVLSTALADEVKATSAGMIVQSAKVSPQTSARNSFRIPADLNLSSLNIIQTLYPNLSVLKLICYPQFMKALSRSASFFTKGMELISILRLIALVSESEQSLAVLHAENVADVLILISSEAEDKRLYNAQGQNGANTKSSLPAHPLELSSSPSLSYMQAFTNVGIPTRPAPVERSVSGSSITSTASNQSQYNNSGRRSHRRSYTPVIHLSSTHDLEEEEIAIDNEVKESSDECEMASEITLLVCFTLANLIAYEKASAARYFTTGLFTIMKDILHGTRDSGICIQSILCIKAMCSGAAIGWIENPASLNPILKSKSLIEALDALSVGLRSTDTEIQLYTISAIASIAPLHETLRDHIVESQLKTILSLSMDPKKKRALSSNVEDLLVKIGFSGGEKDFECCGFDCDLLQVWYSFNRTLKPQSSARIALRNWLENLFPHADSSSEYSFNSRKETELSAHGLADETVEILRANSLGNLYPSSLGHHKVGGATSGGIQASHGPGHHHNHAHSRNRSGELSHMVPLFHRSITDNFLKFLPFCSVRPDPAPKAVNKNNYLSSQEENHFDSMVNSHSSHTPPPDHLHPHYPEKPPIAVTNLLDLFYPSQLHQLMLIDLLSLGLTEQSNVMQVEASSDSCRSSIDEGGPLPLPYSIVNVDFGQPDDGYTIFPEELRTICPLPYEVNAILLPSRPYTSFARMGRMIEKMLQYGGQKLWSLTFSKSVFAGDFHVSLQNTLRKCPQIFSLSFESSKIVEEESLLGHCVGDVPPNIKFLSFKRTLSSLSIQALCILLKTKNAAFTSANCDISYSGKMKSRYMESNNSNNNGFKNLSSGSEYPSGKLQKARLARGLLGLALTNFVFKQVEIEHIIKLLDASTSTSKKITTPMASASSSSSGRKSNTAAASSPLPSSSSSSSAASPSQLSLKALSSPLSVPSIASTVSTPRPADHHANLRGLRYLDLSHDGLGDSSCAQILNAAVNGPLEALELGGNHINGAIDFSDAMKGCDKDKHSSHLRYLGISNNHLTGKAVGLILERLMNNCSITSIDLSANDIEDIESIRMFFINNSTLRVMDLSNNRINMHCISEIDLGLLLNTNMILLPLGGNSSIERSSTLSLVQKKLHHNRVAYARASVVDIDTPSQHDTGSNEEDTSSSKSQLKNYTDEEVTLKSNSLKESHSRKPSAVAVPVSASTPSDVIAVSTKTAAATTAMPVAVMVHAVPDGSSKVATAATHLRKDSASLSSSPSPSSPRCADQIQEKLRPLSLSLSLKGLNGSNNNSVVLKDPPPKLHVFFSSPLATQDRDKNWHTLQLLDYSGERDMLMQVFGEVRRDVAVHFDFATTESLRTALSLGCRALHFSGHGKPGGLCFEDGRSGLQVVSVGALKEFLSAGGISLQFVFVSACYSKAIGEAFVKAGVPHVVCVKVDSQIQDDAAIAFTRAFYVAFFSGRSVMASFSIAKEALKNSPYVANSLLEGEKFILLPDSSPTPTVTSSSITATTTVSSIDTTVSVRMHDEVMFNSREVSHWPPTPMHCTIGRVPTNVTAFVAKNRLPKPPHDFEGREVNIHMLIRMILERRLVSLVGSDGIGKSTVAIAAVNYLADREIFRDSIIFFRAKGLNSYKSFILELHAAIQGSNIGEKMSVLMSERAQSSASSKNNHLYPEEDIIFACLEPHAMLIVIDHIDDLLSDYQTEDFRLFLIRLFEQCPNIKILVVSTDTLRMRNVNISQTMVEYSLTLGPLSLGSTLRLFARLSPSLSTAESKDHFIQRLLPPNQEHATVEMSITRTAADILEQLGNGHPSKIVHAAYESTPESVAAMLNSLGRHSLVATTLLLPSSQKTQSMER